MKNAEKIKHSAQQTTAVNVKHVTYNWNKKKKKMGKMLALLVNNADNKYISLIQADGT